MRSLLRLHVHLAALLVMALLAAAPSAVQGQEETVVFATTGAGAAGFITSIIKQQRLDSKNGLNLDLKPFTPGKAQNVLIARQVEAGIFNPIAMARVNLRGNQVRMFGPLLWNHISILVHPDSDITSIERLKGKKLSILPRVSGSYNTWSLVNRMRGIIAENSYEMIFAPPPVIMGLFLKKEVQAMAIWEPHSTRFLATKKAKEIARIKDLWRDSTGQPMLMIGLAAYQEWIDANPRKAKKVFTTFLDALRLFKANPKKAIAANRKILRVKSDAHAALLEKRFPEVFASDWNEKMIANLELIVKKSAEFGLIKAVPSNKLFLNLQ